MAGGLGWFVAAAVLIQISHVLDCMDGQMARYRKVSSPFGSYLDRLTDQVQVTLWFGAVGYAAYAQSLSAVPVFPCYDWHLFLWAARLCEIHCARDRNIARSRLSGETCATETPGTFSRSGLWRHRQR
nr:CDP-alcohol phosphatidyltransferase family protein [Roseicyclus sp.]